MSKKFTGITSAGSAIPVYDKDAHSALEQKLDTSAFSSVSGEFATVDDVVAAVSGKADVSAIPSLDGYATQEWVGEQGYLTEVPQGVMQTSGLEYNGDKISGYMGSAFAGQTSATNFVAGPGISITQPAEGTVRIANDETVIWTGAGTHYPDKVTTNEPLSAFERFRVIGYIPYAGNMKFCIENVYANDEYFTLSTNQMTDRLIRMFNTSAQMQADGIRLCSAVQGGLWTNAAGTDAATVGKWFETTRSHYITEVIGIKRKEV